VEFHIQISDEQTKDGQFEKTAKNFQIFLPGFKLGTST
jgi:hypothetical protein